MKTRSHCLIAFLSINLLFLGAIHGVAGGEDPEPMLVFDFTKPALEGRIQANPPDLGDSTEAGLRVHLPAGEGGSLTFFPPDERWRLGSLTRLQIHASNDADAPVRVVARALNPGGVDWGNSAILESFIWPGQDTPLNVFLFRGGADRTKYDRLERFEGMNGLPGGWMSHWHTINPDNIERITLTFPATDADRTLTLRKIEGTHPAVPRSLREDPDGFFPFIDRFGQYKHDDWPGKVHDDAQLQEAPAREAEDLASHAGPEDWNPYGGWAGGPQEEATGFFRAEKIDGRWWLIDPDGRLFWSHGPNSVNFSASTRVTGREDFFAHLPEKDGSLAFAWSGLQSDSPEGFDFLGANLHRQLGDDWREITRDLAHRRLRSWGMNTIGNWSSAAIYSQQRTPYVTSVSLWGFSLTDGPYRAYDVFHEDFAAHASEIIARGTRETADDPWCIGYFVDNELLWANSPLAFMNHVVEGAETMRTKQHFVDHLRRHFGGDIAAFNEAAGVSFESWEEILANRERINLGPVEEPVTAFYRRYCRRYFEIVREALDEFAPNHLYLGPRMHVWNDVAVEAAAEFCDVLSFNLYRRSLAGFDPGFDKPVIVGEFHFGALDRGFFHTGLMPVSSQRDRAAMYKTYVNSALKNPAIVGTHWFTFGPQPFTGRGDGENYQIGLFDIANQPYPETREALREVGYSMYLFRAAP